MGFHRLVAAASAAVVIGVAALAGLGGAPAWAQPRPLPAEMFFKPAEVLDAKLSPSGRRVAFTSSIRGGRIGLFVWSLEGGTKLSQAARFSDADVRTFEWLGDERLVFDLTDLASGSGEQLAPGLFAVQPDGQGLRQLVMQRHRPFIVEPGAGRPALPWNHVLLHVPAGGDEVIVGELHLRDNDLEAVTPRRLDVATGRVQSLPIELPLGTTRWLFDARGEPRVAVARREGRSRVLWREAGSTRWGVIADDPLGSARFSPSFVDAEDQLYVVRSAGPAGEAVVTRFDFASGQPRAQPLVTTPGFDFNGTLIGDAPAGGRLLGVRVNTDAEATIWLDPAMKRMQQRADERLPGYATRMSCRRCGQPDMVALVRAWTARDPGHVWLYTAADDHWQLLSRVRRDIDPTAMATVEFERIRARDGRDLPVWLTIPPGRKAGDRGPAVVLAHGGPWVRGGAWQWRPLEQFLASRGYLVVSPEFRGSAGYGAAHLRAGFKQWGRAMQDDVADAAQWAIDRGWADRLCIAGASYGGYATLMGLVNDPRLYRCGVAWLAVADPLLYVEGSWLVRDDIPETGRRYSLPEMVGDATKDAEMLKAVSPVLQAARINAPLLLAYGGRDLRVPLAHGQRLRRALREAGHEPEWVVYDDEAHGWFKLSTQIDFAGRVEAFLGRHLAK